MTDDDAGETGATADRAPSTADPRAASLLAAVRDALAEDRPHTLADLARATGTDLDDLGRLFAAARRNAADDAYGDTDLAYARDLRLLAARSSVKVVERELRLRQRLVTQIVIDDLSTIRLDTTLGAMLDAGAAPDALARELTKMAREVVPAVERQLGADYRAALLRLLGSEVVSQVATDTTTLPTMAVGFVDLVGFTRLSASTDPEGVGALLTAFEDVASGAAEDAGEVLLAKTIGDAVMFVGGSPDEVAAALLHTVDREPHDLQDVDRRAGMAFGEVLIREGDYVGTTVNTAARLTDLARPGSLVVASEAAEVLADDWRTSRLPPKRLKGLGTTRAVRVRWPADDDTDA